jgi:hypothetical protein
MKNLKIKNYKEKCCQTSKDQGNSKLQIARYGPILQKPSN